MLRAPIDRNGVVALGRHELRTLFGFALLILADVMSFDQLIQIIFNPSVLYAKLWPIKKYFPTVNICLSSGKCFDLTTSDRLVVKAFSDVSFLSIVALFDSTIQYTEFFFTTREMDT